MQLSRPPRRNLAGTSAYPPKPDAVAGAAQISGLCHKRSLAGHSVISSVRASSVGGICERRAAPRPGRVAEEILKQLGHVAEGLYFAPAIEALAAEKRVDMPITRTVCAVLFRGTPPRDAVQELLALDPREEA